MVLAHGVLHSHFLSVVLRGHWSLCAMEIFLRMLGVTIVCVVYGHLTVHAWMFVCALSVVCGIKARHWSYSIT